MQGKRVLLGVTGGIAAYKSPDLVRRLREQGAEVQVVLTAGAREFVTPMTFQAVSGREVRSDLWDPEAEKAMSHIELARWADFVIIAPATADFLARLATGQADDLLTTLCLATDAPIALAPAMNRLMWSNRRHAGQRRRRSSRAASMSGARARATRPAAKSAPAACSNPRNSPAFVANTLAPTGPLAGKRVLLTAGPTRERIDPVRFISNRSSGKMGFAVAAAAREAGADVTIVCGPVNLATPPGVKRIDVESAADMLNAVMKNIDGVDIFVATAAVADYRPANPVECKIKKTSESMDLKMERTVDILATVAARNGAARPFVVGFAAETDSVEQYARQKLLKKNLDMIAANEVGHDKVFEKDDNALLVLWRDGRRELPHAPKVALARDLVALIAERYAERNPASCASPACPA